ncbi:Protein of unknown function [Klenkia soli]|uniref:DUF2505 domain-containing protein n=1 Tax=Klenkia soli TaxID=1052260 RepID=A0A1H0L6H3_9ACTN|nr:DUF2505 family protein [Klenkia soli]SDO63839.1 Protein of unknown function [Klenkia soli]
MPFTYETTVDASPQAVVDTLTDESFVRAALADLGAQVKDVTVDGTTTTARYSVPTTGIPEAFARFVGDRVELTDVRTWTVNGDSATGTVLVTTTLFGRDVRLEGERRITPGSTISSTGRSHVDAPFVGRKAEGSVDQLAVVVLGKEAATLAARLG